MRYDKSDFLKIRICEYVINNTTEYEELWEVHINESTCELNSSKVNKNYLEKKYYKVCNLDKPFKSVTTYKLQDLKDIASKFGISITKELTVTTLSGTIKNKTKTKKELYSEILEKI